ncbi:MAG: hypothetical protein LUD22_01180 [Coprobacillus sp.]|nr:hypothetical protein [Coprobacillus sp.]
MPKEKKIKKNKKELKFRRKINAICVDFRLYSKAKKSAIIEPCVDEFHKKVNSGFSEKEATKLICHDCQLALERKYEKHNKFLSLLLFSFVVGLFAFVVEFSLFYTAFEDMSSTLGFIIWSAAIMVVFILFVIWAGLTHNGRWFGYFVTAIYILLWLVTCAMLIYFSYFSLDGGCLTTVFIDFNSEFFVNVRQFTGEINSLGECVRPVGQSSFNITDFSGYNIDTIGTLVIFGIVLIIYLCEHARLNTHYCRNKINNLCTQYGINKKVDRKEIREGALLQYYTYLDQGLSKKDANKRVLAETAEILGRDHKKHSRVLFSFVIVIIFAIYAIYEYISCGLYFVYNMEWAYSIFFIQIGALFVFGIIFIIMLLDWTHFYWYDYIIMALILISIFVMGLNFLTFDYTHFDSPYAGSITFDGGPFYFIQNINSFEETFIEGEGYIYNPDVIVSTSTDYLFMYNSILAIVYFVIFIPTFAVSHHKIKKERKNS